MSKLRECGPLLGHVDGCTPFSCLLEHHNLLLAISYLLLGHLSVMLVVVLMAVVLLVLVVPSRVLDISMLEYPRAWTWVLSSSLTILSP